MSLTEDEGVSSEDHVIKIRDAIKPDGTEFKSENQRTKDTLVYVGTLSNTGAVDAEVTVSKTEIDDSEYVTAAGETGYDGYAYTEGELAQHFLINVCYATSKLESDDVEKGYTKNATSLHTFSDSEPLILYTEDEVKEDGGLLNSVYIYFDVMWISDLAVGEDSGNVVYANGDDFDTWVGTNVDSISVTVTINAVQYEATT